ncbi:MAG: hypothetical protein ABJB76_06035 [Candidatus Nitrosocosmicus sp.]
MQRHSKDRIFDKAMLTNSTKNIPDTKRLRTIQEIEKHFPGLIAFIDRT